MDKWYGPVGQPTPHRTDMKIGAVEQVIKATAPEWSGDAYGHSSAMAGRSGRIRDAFFGRRSRWRNDCRSRRPTGARARRRVGAGGRKVADRERRHVAVNRFCAAFIGHWLSAATLAATCQRKAGVGAAQPFCAAAATMKAAMESMSSRSNNGKSPVSVM